MTMFMRNYLWISILFYIGILPFASAQIRVSGKVTEKGSTDGLPGATVAVKGTSDGVATDLDGTYSIEVPSGDAVLIFSFVGLESQEIQVGSQREINVVLQLDATLIEEVVVVGYGTQKRSAISGAVSTISSDEIAKTPVLRAEQALQGRTAGVQVTQNSGSPGSTLTVRVRGVGTINNSEPLYLIDGVPAEGIDFLNPNDIASINVLKDAASAAIYGARGANGVVLITTRSGKSGESATISYDAYVGIQGPWKKMHLLNAREYAIISNEAHIASGRLPRPEFSNPDLLGEGTDWQEAIFEEAPMASHQLTITGGSALSTYSLSGSYFSQDGIVGGPKAGFERYNARFNATHQPKKWLNIGSTMVFTSLERQGLPENNEFNTPLIRALNIDPVTSVRKYDGTYNYSVYADTDIGNPVNSIEQTHNTWRSKRLLGSVFGELQLARGLTLRSAYSVDATFAFQDLFFPKFDLSIDPQLGDAPSVERSINNSVVKSEFTWSNWQWENVLTYRNQGKKGHDFSAMVGTTALENTFRQLTGANTNLPSNRVEDAYLGNTIDPRESQSAGDFASASSLLSYFGRVNYGLKERYLLSATFRMDGSSRFGANNRYGFFPSVSGAWILSREPFWNSPAVSLLKFRGSWGQNGNDRIGDYSYTTIVLPGQNYTFGSNERITNGSAPQEASNPDLKWETSEQTNFGLDLEMWQGKLNFTGDYYIKTTRDMLSRVPIPAIAGVRPPFQNVGTMQNQGLELALQHRNKKGDFTYQVGGNIAFVRTEVLSLGEGGEPIVAGNVFSAGNVSRTQIGHPVAAFYGYVTDGIFQTVEEVKAHAFQNAQTAPGDVRFKDLNGDGTINDADRTFIGNPTPDFTYGVTLEAGFKGFDASLFIQGSYGNEIYNGIFRYDFFYTNRPQSALLRWTGPGTSNFQPRANLNDPNNNARASDRFIEDGSHLRVRNVQLGYSLPQSVLKRLKLQKFRAYIGAQNLFTFTRYSGLDPEIGVVGGALEIGIDQGFYPQARTFLTGVNVSF
jgi:TonB-linked SusC/RagA family outer membrane protein